MADSTPTPAYDFLTGEGKVQEKVARVRTMLADVPLFKGLSDRYLDEIGRLSVPEERPANDELVRQGDQGADFVLIVDGSARVERNGQVIAHINAGDYIGELALLDGQPRTATVITDEPSTVLILRKHAFDHIVESNPELEHHFLLTLVQRIRDLQATLMDQQK